ncbi:tetratricopeptide repeat protein [Novosphingobium tardum]|uniref:Tetratricopeptide repeat protein n=1 Tax=Novosphingobium tardum TaxID=1538021 RepID=A0ABV8RQ67_9SPHN
MTWVLILGAALAVFAGLVFLLKLPRAGWELVGAALLLGIAGYALQGHPGQPGSPREAVDVPEGAKEEQIAERQAMGAGFGKGQSWLIIADSMSRRGQYGSAADILRSGIHESPNDPDLWVALGNALVGHSDGFIGPAAQFAFQRAATISPEHPGPPFFMGLALAQSGRLAEARTIWAELLARAPAGASWKDDLEQRLARLDAMIAQSGPAAAPAP